MTLFELMHDENLELSFYHTLQRAALKQKQTFFSTNKSSCITETTSSIEQTRYTYRVKCIERNSLCTHEQEQNRIKCARVNHGMC